MKSFSFDLLLALVCFLRSSNGRAIDVEAGGVEIAAVYPPIIGRAGWGARSPNGASPLSAPKPYAIVHHTDTPECNTSSSCIARVQSIQNYHMDNNYWNDIGYNFLIGGDGIVYEGRGWDTRGAHAVPYNSLSQGIAMIGTFNAREPSSKMLNTLNQLLDYMVTESKLNSCYTLFGHRQASATSCPGDALYAVLQAHPHYRYDANSVGNPNIEPRCYLHVRVKAEN